MKNFDLFGQKLNFYMDQEMKFKTKIGSILTILSYILIVVISFLFGEDFYFKKNPKVFTENILTDQYTKVRINPSNFIFTIRIEDGDGNSIPDIDKYFKINIIYKNFTLNKNINSFESNHKYLNNVKCNDTLVPSQKFSQNKNLSEWQCIDFPEEGFDFGGSWSGDYVQYMTIHITNQNNKSNVDDTDDNFSYINNTEVIKYYKSNNLYISMYYQMFYFTPNNITNPTNIMYNNYYVSIGQLINKSDRINFKSYYLEDDIGWILSTKNNSEIIGFSSKEIDYDLMNEQDLISLKENFYYNLSFYYSSNYEKNHRAFMKFQELAALVGGFLKIILFIAKIVLNDYTIFEMYKKIISLTINYSSFTKEKEENKEIDNSSSNLKQNKMNNFIKSKEKIKESPQKVEIVDLTQLTKERKTSNQLKKQIQFSFDHNQNEEKISKYSFSYFSYLFSHINRNNIVYKRFALLKKYFNSQIDYISYIKLINQVNILKSITLNENQLNAIELCNRIKYKDDEKLNIEEINLILNNLNEKNHSIDENKHETHINNIILSSMN